jgi:hypothetical protein
MFSPFSCNSPELHNQTLSASGLSFGATAGNVPGTLYPVYVFAGGPGETAIKEGGFTGMPLFRDNACRKTSEAKVFLGRRDNSAVGKIGVGARSASRGCACMICHRGETVYENLSSECNDVPKLLSTLRAEVFSGIVAIQAVGKKGIFFVSAGEIIDAISGTEADPTTTAGEQAVKEIFALCTQPSATLDVYKLSAREVEFAVTTLQSEMVFKGLSTDFVRLDRFLNKLSAQRHNGYIEVTTKDNQPVGIISLRDGKADQLFTAPAVGVSSFSVSENRTAGSNGHQYAPDLRSEGASSSGVEERTQFVVDLQGTLFKIEKFVNGFAETGGFQRAFKRACVEKSESYPFLDPFEGQFDYSGGRIHLDGQVPMGAFVIGIAECLDLTLTYLEREIPNKTVLPASLKRDIEILFRGYRDVITESGLQSVIPSAFQ